MCRGLFGGMRLVIESRICRDRREEDRGGIPTSSIGGRQ